MIRLARIGMREIVLPLVEPFETSAGVVGERRILLLEITDADGIGTWSECVAESLPTYSPDTVDTCWLALKEWIIPSTLGKPFPTPRELNARLESSIRGHRMARASVEMGAWAIEALQRGTSLAALLAGKSTYAQSRGDAPKSVVESGIALGMHANPDDLAQRSLAAVAEGYRRIKLKIAPGRDVEYVRRVRDAVGSSVSLSVDANGSYSLDNAEHMRALDTLDTLELTMIEQPLAHDDLAGHAKLQSRLETPICLDESISSDAAANAMLVLGSARMVNLKPGRVGGFVQSLAIHDRCASAGVPVWCGGMLECGIGRAYNVALASLPNFTEPGDLSPSARYWARDVVTPPWTMSEKGTVSVPLARAGIGVDVDTGFIDDLTARQETFAAR